MSEYTYRRSRPGKEALTDIKDISDEVGTCDEYFTDPPQDTALGLVLDGAVELLPPQMAEVIRMRVYESLSFGKIAKEFGWQLPSGAWDRKQAYRVYHEATKELRSMLTGFPLSVMGSRRST